MNKLELKNDSKDWDRTKINNDGLAEYIIHRFKDIDFKLKILTKEIVLNDKGKWVSARASTVHTPPLIVKEPIKPPLKDIPDEIDWNKTSG